MENRNNSDLDFNPVLAAKQIMEFMGCEAKYNEETESYEYSNLPVSPRPLAGGYDFFRIGNWFKLGHTTLLHNTAILHEMATSLYNSLLWIARNKCSNVMDGVKYLKMASKLSKSLLRYRGSASNFTYNIPIIAAICEGINMIIAYDEDEKV